MYYKLATEAAKWWIKQMKQRYQQIFHTKTSGFGSNIVILDTTLAEKFCIFEELLRNNIQENLEKYHYFHTGCCYYPNDLLVKLAEEADISTSYFPIHAQLTIAKNSIYVSVGYEDLYKLNIN